MKTSRYPSHMAVLRRYAAERLSRLRRLPDDQRGTISILTVFSLLMFTMLLILISNVATHVDDKIKMQNAADASAYSGGVIIARGLNALAYSNHLLADTFAITAFLRESQERSAEQLTPQILDRWEQVADVLSRAEFDKFSQLAGALQQHTIRERQLIEAFGNLSELSAAYALPVFEYILSGEQPDADSGPPSGLISEFQRTVIQTVPALAQQATSEVAFRQGTREGDVSQYRNREDRADQVGVLWRSSVLPVWYSDESHPLWRTLPVVDPDPYQLDLSGVPGADLYLATALQERAELAKYYLEQWTQDKLRLFDREARGTQFSNLWRIITCARLESLLNDEYPLTNLPMQLRRLESLRSVEETVGEIERLTGLSRRRESDIPELLAAVRNQMDLQTYIDRDFHFVSTVYRQHVPERGPGLFRNPMRAESDALTFAQVRVFPPRPRRFLTYAGSGSPPRSRGLGGSFGVRGSIDLPSRPAVPGEQSPELERWPLENWPTHWDLLNQNWTVQLVPATLETLPEILQTPPGDVIGNYRPPHLGNLTIRDIKKISTH